MDNDIETWLPVLGWEGLYEVSDRGHVRSVPRKGARGRVLKPALSHGYWSVTPCRDGKAQGRPAHILVLEAFAGPRPDGMVARHGTAGNLVNTWPENLCWGTPSENVQDMWRDGTMPCGERQWNAKLTADGVLTIRTRYANGETTEDLALAYGLHPGYVSLLITGKRWGHVTGGLHVLTPGEQRHRCPIQPKLSPDDIRAIRSRYLAGGITQTGLAEEYGVGQTCISRAVRLDSWKDVA